MKAFKNTISSIDKKRRFRVIVLVLLVVVTTIFIWSNSLESRSESQIKSLNVLEILTPILEPFVGKGNVTDYLVRKLGHFSEFCILGTELALIINTLNRVRFQSIVNCMSISLAVAVVDESLQIISSRGSQVSDVLLDFCGSFTGIVFILLIYLIFIAQKSTKNA